MERDVLESKIRNFLTDVAVTFKRTKQRTQEALWSVERTKFDPEIETQWWMLLTAQKEMKVLFFHSLEKFSRNFLYIFRILLGFLEHFLEK